MLDGVDDDESVGHLSSGFEWGLSPSNKSVGDDGGDTNGSTIVAYDATRREKTTNVLVLRLRMICK